MTTTMPPIENAPVTSGLIAADESKQFDAIARDIELRERMSDVARTERELTASLYGLLYDAISTDVEQRSQLRESLTAPVSILLGDNYQVSGVTRDISTDGIGLVHPVPVECQNAVVKVFDENDKPAVLYVAITWCKAIGRGWYASGGRFIYKIDSNLAVLTESRSD